MYQDFGLYKAFFFILSIIYYIPCTVLSNYIYFTSFSPYDNFTMHYVLNISNETT